MTLIHGREVEVAGKGKVKLQTMGAELLSLSPSIRSKFLGFIADPTIAYILFTLGVWILLAGLFTVGPEGEIIGGILLVLGLIGLGFNVDLFAIILIVAGGVLLVAEMLQPGLQVFGPAGIISLVLGSLFLLRLDPSRWLVSQEWYTFFFGAVVVSVIVMASFASFILYKVLKLPKQQIVLKWVVGETGRAVDTFDPGQEGYIQSGGEYWRAKASVRIEAGQEVTIVGKDGPVLIVKPKETVE
jgi:membrane-bound serine protease (ClpP class)